MATQPETELGRSDKAVIEKVMACVHECFAGSRSFHKDFRRTDVISNSS
jgi:hypothetical protein